MLSCCTHFKLCAAVDGKFAPKDFGDISKDSRVNTWERIGFIVINNFILHSGLRLRATNFEINLFNENLKTSHPSINFKHLTDLT
jgi:hypothetical protein